MTGPEERGTHRTPAAVWAVIPVFDEAPTIHGVVDGIRATCPIVVVDDGSRDGSADRAAAAGAEVVLRHARRRGKGAALRSGFAEALRRGAAHVVTVDGDAQHDPEDVVRLLVVAAAAPDALILGDRLGHPGGDPMPLGRRVAGRVADVALSWLTGLPLRDTQCGLRVYPAPLLRGLTPIEGHFVLEAAAVVEAVEAGYAVRSVPVRRIYCPGRRSRFRALGDGARIAWYLVRRAAARRPGARGDRASRSRRGDALLDRPREEPGR